MKSFRIRLLRCHLSPALKEIIRGLLSCVLVLRLFKSSRLGHPPVLRVPLSCQSSTKETLNHHTGDRLSALPARVNLPPGKSQVLAIHLSHICAYWLPRIACFFLLFSVSSCYLMHCTSTTSPLNHWLSFYDCLAPDSLAYQGLCNIQDREADRAWLSDPPPFSCFAGNEVPSKEHHELKPYVHHLHVIDNQQALFELSHRIEPRV